MTLKQRFVIVLLTRKDIRKGESLIDWEVYREPLITTWQEEDKPNCLEIGRVVDDHAQQLLSKTDS